MVLEFILNIIIAMLIIGLFNFIRGVLRVRKILKKYKDDPTVEGITIVNGKVNVIRKGGQTVPKEEAKELVMDPICQKMLEKEKAFRVVKEEKEYFFCSWECREAFLKAQKGEVE